METSTLLVRKTKKKENAQGFVEFALAIPLLLSILYGLLEVGRLLFIYSSTVTAARQAVRYGAVTGVNDGGILRFQDCAGMRSAAKSMGFVSEFQDSAIDITFDAGPGTAAFASCDGVDYLAVEPETGDRLLVSVSSDYEPIVPLVPLKPMLIESSSSRTILVDIAIDSTPVPVGGATSTPFPTYTYTPTATDTPTNTPTPTNTATSTPTLAYSPTPSKTPTITNTPTKTLTPTKTATPTDTGTPTNIPSPTATPIECHVSHTGISADQDRMLLTLYNESAYPITLKEVTVFYNASSPAGQAIAAVYSNEVLIWNQPLPGSPITISNLEGTTPIDPWSSMAFKLFFNKNLKVDGTENIIFSFVENGCPVYQTAP